LLYEKYRDQIERTLAKYPADQKRSAVMPELPTVDEAGVAGYVGGSWYGIALPAREGLAVASGDAADVDRLARDIGGQPVSRRYSSEYK